MNENNFVQAFFFVKKIKIEILILKSRDKKIGKIKQIRPPPLLNQSTTFRRNSLTGTSEKNLESKLLLPISSIENVKKLKMDGIFEDTKEDGELSDFLPGFSLFDESKFDMNDLIKIS